MRRKQQNTKLICEQLDVSNSGVYFKDRSIHYVESSQRKLQKQATILCNQLWQS